MEVSSEDGVVIFSQDIIRSWEFIEGIIFLIYLREVKTFSLEHNNSSNFWQNSKVESFWRARDGPWI